MKTTDMKDPFNTVARTAGELERRLLLAAEKGNAAEVSGLLGTGANPAAADEFQWTALHLAAKAGHDETVRILLSKGVDIDARTNFNNTAADLARKAGKTSTEKILLTAIDRRNRTPAAAPQKMTN